MEIAISYSVAYYNNYNIAIIATSRFLQTVLGIDEQLVERHGKL